MIEDPACRPILCFRFRALMLFPRASRGVELSLCWIGRLAGPALARLHGGADSLKIRLDLIKAQVVGRAAPLACRDLE